MTTVMMRTGDAGEDDENAYDDDDDDDEDTCLLPCQWRFKPSTFKTKKRH